MGTLSLPQSSSSRAPSGPLCIPELLWQVPPAMEALQCSTGLSCGTASIPFIPLSQQEPQILLMFIPVPRPVELLDVPFQSCQQSCQPVSVSYLHFIRGQVQTFAVSSCPQCDGVELSFVEVGHGRVPRFDVNGFG